MNTEGHLPAVVPHQGDVITRGNFAAIGGMANVQSSLPNETPKQRSRIVEMIEQDSVPGETASGTVIEIQDYICHAVHLTDPDTGEGFEAIRTLLIDSSGKTTAFVSASIMQALDRLAYAVGRSPPFAPPVRAKLTRRNIGRGRHVYGLSLEP